MNNFLEDVVAGSLYMLLVFGTFIGIGGIIWVLVLVLTAMPLPSSLIVAVLWLSISGGLCIAIVSRLS